MDKHLDTMTTTKRSLAVLCSALETSIASQPHRREGNKRAVVLALFQRRGYFEQARQRYVRLAASGAQCVVAFGGDVDGLPAGVNGVSLNLTDALSGEWSLVVLDGALGASLVARDLGDVDPTEDTFEAGRLLSANWAFSATRAAAEDDASSMDWGAGSILRCVERCWTRSGRAWTASPRRRSSGWPTSRRCWCGDSMSPTVATTALRSRCASSARTPSATR